jgi:capsular exopolysaccharide synthesis family protein
VSPNKTLNIAIAFGAGLLLALGIAYLLDYLDQSIKSDEELTERLGLIAIGHIAFVPAAKGRRAELLALGDSQSGSSEAYKALRTSLLFSTIDKELKTVVITSPGPGEGKTRTAANLAVVLGEAGYKTLLIDADFRRPSQHKIFGRTRNVGLSNLILQDVDENEAIVAVDQVPNLWLVTSGPIPPNPSELLGSGRIRELMARLRSAFTYVILDTPPVNAVTDAAILASIANGTMLVVEQGRTTFPALGHSVKLLDRVGARTLGVVMNKVRPSAGSYSYGYGYYGTPRDERAEQEAGQPSESEPRITVKR